MPPRQHCTAVGVKRGALVAAAAACLLAGLAGCTSQPPIETGSGPIKSSEACPLDGEEVVPGATLPAETLRAFEGCVATHANGEQRQAAGWIRDWYHAARCLHRCDPKGIGSIAHTSMWQGLRYITAATLPSPDQLASECREAQRAMVVALDESMNHLAGWTAVSGPQCASTARMQTTLRRIAEAQQYRDRLTGRIKSFQQASQ